MSETPLLSTRVTSSRAQRIEIWLTERRRLLWNLHSLWALATGAFVIYLAHDNYRFIPWLFGFLGLTWVSTLVFGYLQGWRTESRFVRLGGGVVSYMTRVIYQETLFFLIPFYAYSTSWNQGPHWNSLFLVLLVVLATLSCIDLLFDRLLRSSRVFGLFFFAVVAFAALNLVIPIIFRVEIELATQIASAVAAASAIPLSIWGSRGGAFEKAAIVVGALLAAIVLPKFAHVLVPPTPMRMQEAFFAKAIDTDPLRPRGPLEAERIARSELDDQLAIVLRVFAPTRLPANAQIEWFLDGEAIRQSRAIPIVGHEAGFRVWDALVFEAGSVAPGRYEVTLRLDGRPLGHSSIEVLPE